MVWERIGNASALTFESVDMCVLGRPKKWLVFVSIVVSVS